MPHQGFCARVALPDGLRVRGDCLRDSIGGWIVPHTHTKNVSGWCHDACQQCARCRHVSFNPNDVPHRPPRCHWFTHCNLDDLRTEADTRWETVTVRVDAPMPLPTNLTDSSQRPVRLGVASVLFGGVHGCGLLGWCQAATRFRDALNVRLWRVTLVIVHAEPRHATQLDRRDCPHAEYIRADKRLRALAYRCVRDKLHSRLGFHTRMTSEIMLKWQIVGLANSYDLIFLVDVDVDAMPLEFSPADVAHRWDTLQPLFHLRRARDRHLVDGVPVRGAELRLLGSADHESPLNTGHMILRPSLQLYKEGLRVLARCDANATHGWDRVGPPATLDLSVRYLDPALQGATARRPLRSSRLRERMRRVGQVDDMCFACLDVPLKHTVAFRQNTWAFLGGAEDQGYVSALTMLIRH